jgi:hypothetical protein
MTSTQEGKLVLVYLEICLLSVHRNLSGTWKLKIKYGRKMDLKIYSYSQKKDKRFLCTRNEA